MPIVRISAEIPEATSQSMQRLHDLCKLFILSFYTRPVLHTSCLNCNTLSGAMLCTLAPALHDNTVQAASSHTVNVRSLLCVAAVDGLTLYKQQQK